MKKATKRLWKLSSQMLLWMLVISLIVSAVPVFPAQSAAAAELPIQQTAVTKSNGFQDVSPTDWFHDAVVQVQDKGIFSGTTASTFSPKGTMTRAMYVTVLGRMAGVDTGAYSTSSFADVQVGSWYAPYVEWAVKEGITDGTGGGKYSPNATVSREQMATMTLRYFESEQIPYQTENTVTTEPGDLADVSPWAADAVVKLWQAGVFTGDEKGNFKPLAQATRAEAAVLFMRNNAVVEAWKNQNELPVTPTPTPAQPVTPTPTSPVTSTPMPSPGGNSGGGTPGDNGGNPGTGSTAYTLTFESNGGTAVAGQTIRKGQVLNNLPAPTKEGYIFQGWFTDSDFSLIFAEGSTVTSDTKLYAKYTDSVENAVQSTPSYSVLDVAPDFTIAVHDASGNLTVPEVQAGMTFTDTANPDFAGITVTGGNGAFTVASAAEDGKFVEGNTYQLTLNSDNLSFQGQDATTSIYVFSVAKQEVLDIPLNPNMIYLPYTDVTDMMLNGTEVGSPAISVVATTVGGSENALAEANASSGTFVYSGSTVIQVGNTVAIYQGVRPDQRTLETTGADDGDVAYVQITAVDGSTYTYDHADIKQVLLKPDVLPVSVEADTDGEPNNKSITVEHTQMNYSDSLYEPFGLDELTTVDVGDFIGFYKGEFGAETGFKTVGYGRITSITPAAEMDVIEYTDATIEDIENAFNIYQKQAIDGEDLLSEEQIAELEEQIEQQARDSGFVDQAADYLSDLAMETKDIKDLKEIQQIKAQSSLASGKGSRVSVEKLTVVASLGTKLKNINGRSSGVSATLQVGADIVVDINEDSNLVIHMTSTFVQEMSLDLGINGDMQGHWLKKWGIPYWYSIDDYVITANLDAYSYTGLNITAEMALVEPDKLQAALNNWAGEKKAGRLGQVQDIATQIKASMDGVQGTSVDTEELKEQYQEMLEQDTEWVPLIKKELFEKSVRVAFGIVEVKFEAEFVVSAQVNLTMGADFYYKMAKRYSVTLRVLSFSGSSNTVSLPGDGDYQFTFYVMGTLGLRAGIHMEVKAGIGSVKLNSIGLAVEPGVYINLWGYFYYQLKNVSGVKTTKSLGALFVEMGIYLEVELGAQLGDGALSGSVGLVDEEWPLYTIGEEKNVYDFAYPQDDELGLLFRGDADSRNLPESFFKMNTFDLKTGMSTQETYDSSQFDIQLSGNNFRFSLDKKGIYVGNKTIPSSAAKLVITWKGAPLSFTSAPIKRTIPLNWIKSADGDLTIEFDPSNGGPSEIVTAAFNAALHVKNKIPVNPGYTFDGWYTSAYGGTKVEIPNRMPTGISKLYAHWVVNTNTPYKVNHYLIDANSEKLSVLTDSETQTGTTNTEIRITSNKYKDRGYNEVVVRGIYIKGDGSTVVNIYYKPISRTVTFNLGYEGAPEGKLTDLIYKNIANRIPVPTRTGYTFAGWSPDVPNTMPTDNATYTANWTVRDDTPYKVVYLQQDIGHPTYTVVDVETHRGITNTRVTLSKELLRSYEGFTVDTAFPGTVLDAEIASNGTTVLRVYYTRNTYKLTIDYNDLNTPTKEIDVQYGSTTSLHFGEPIWAGHEFKGWSSVPAVTMPAQDIEYIAQWDIDQHTVKFNSNGGVEEVPDQTLAYGKTAIEPATPTKKDHAFGGWYSDSDLTKTYNFATSVTSNITLYAKWMRGYTMSINSNGGTEISDQAVYEGTKPAAPQPPTREGYVFGGWFSDKDLTKAYNFTTEIVKGDITLYVKWVVAQKTQYRVRFFDEQKTEPIDQLVTEGGVAVAPEPLTKPNHTFLFWRDKEKRNQAFDFTTPIMRNYEIYTAWTPNSYEVSFMSDGKKLNSQSVSYQQYVKEPSSPMREGYVFKGWYSDSDLTSLYNFRTQVTSEMSLYAKWTANFTVRFDSKGGPAVDARTVEYNAKIAAPASPKRTGYEFGGWYSDEGLTSVYNFETPVTTNFTLYAKWTSVFTIIFDHKDGSAVTDQQPVLEGKVVSEPAAPHREGYTFIGWYSDEDLTNVYHFETPVTTNITLYAKWKVLYTVSISSSQELIRQTVAEGDVVAIPEAFPPRSDGWIVYWWYVKGKPWADAYNFETPVTGNFELDAYYGRPYTVNFESSGGSAVASQILGAIDKVKVPEPPVKPGFVFEGWYRDTRLTSAYDFGMKMSDLNINSILQLYAKWLPLDDKETNDNDMNFLTDDKTVAEDSVVSLASKSIMDSYIYAGWYADQKRTIPIDFITPVMSKRTIYEFWGHK
ncbi:InlB B-repeat-containing protein [Paenibacillus xylanexedens]|uniref:InlB B-repeat-containing protein n=1 Tax=Paenibacillus xylanexedens TaxID=528191 RepID=UPI003D080B8C